MKLYRLVSVAAAAVLATTLAVPPALAFAAPQDTLGERSALDAAMSVTDISARIAALEQFVAKHPQSAFVDQAMEGLVRSHASVGEVALKARDAKAAAAAFTKALSAAPAKISDRLFSQVVWQMPVVMAAAGYRFDGIQLMRNFEKRFEAEPQRLVQIGYFYVSIESPKDAVRVLERAAELAPGDHRAWNSLGTAYIISLRVDDAANAFEKAIALDPKEEFAYTSLGHMRRATGNVTEAIELYKKQLEIKPEDPGAWGGLSIAYLMNDDEASGSTALSKALALAPGDFRLYTQLAFFYASRGRIDKAREAVELALRYEPRFSWGHITLGNILLAEKRFPEAIEALNRAQNYGDFPTIHFELGKAYMASDQYDEAIDQFKAAFDITDDGQFETSLGDVLSLRTRKLDTLLERERQAVLFLSEQPTTATQYRLAEALARIGHYIELIPDGAQPAVASSGGAPLYPLSMVLLAMALEPGYGQLPLPPRKKVEEEKKPEEKPEEAPAEESTEEAAPSSKPEESGATEPAAEEQAPEPVQTRARTVTRRPLAPPPADGVVIADESGISNGNPLVFRPRKVDETEAPATAATSVESPAPASETPVVEPAPADGASVATEAPSESTTAPVESPSVGAVESGSAPTPEVTRPEETPTEASTTPAEAVVETPTEATTPAPAEASATEAAPAPAAVDVASDDPEAVKDPGRATVGEVAPVEAGPAPTDATKTETTSEAPVEAAAPVVSDPSPAENPALTTEVLPVEITAETPSESPAETPAETPAATPAEAPTVAATGDSGSPTNTDASTISPFAPRDGVRTGAPPVPVDPTVGSTTAASDAQVPAPSTTPDDIQTPAPEMAVKPPAPKLDPDVINKLDQSVDQLVTVDDGREPFRKVWVARVLAEKGVLLEKAERLASEALDASAAATTLDKSVRDMPQLDRGGRLAVFTARAESVLGWVLFKQGKRDEALPHLAKGASEGQTDPEFSSRVWQYATAKLDTGDEKGALALFVKAFDPAAPTARFRKGQIENLYLKVNGSLDGLEDVLKK